LEKDNLILIVDDEPSIRQSLTTLFRDEGYQAISAGTAEQGLELMSGLSVSVVMLDIKLPGMSGIEMLSEIKRRSPLTEVVMMTSYASVDTAVQSIRRDAYDYIQKPFEDLEQVLAVARRAMEKRSLIIQNRELLDNLSQKTLELAAAVKRQKALTDAGRAMNGILDISELLDFFIGVVAEELNVSRASLMLLDEKTGEMWIAASRGLNPEMVTGVRLKLGEGIAGWVAREGKPILVKDVESDPRVKVGLESTNAPSFISAPIVLSIPILIHEKVLGVINVTNRRTKTPFSEEDMEFLFSLAAQAAVAIQRAKQFEDLEEAYRALREKQKSLSEEKHLQELERLGSQTLHGNVLVVENGELNRGLFEKYLRMLGYCVFHASTTDEARTVIEKESLCLVITNVSVRGTSGWEIAEISQNLRPGIPVVLTTGWGVPHRDVRIGEYGIRCVLEKPFSLTDLQAAIVTATSSGQTDS